MKTAIVKMFLILLSVVFIVPFGAAALLAGARLFATTESPSSIVARKLKTVG